MHCTKKLCDDLKDLAMEVINLEKNEMVPLTDDEIKYYKKWKYCHICKKKIVTIKMIKINLNYIKKLEIIVTTQENLEMWLTIFTI